MCGVVGFVGKSINPTRTYELITNLLKETKIRGTNATGFYSIDDAGLIDWYKIDKPADEFVKCRAWKNQCPNAIALIAHARLTTHGTEKKEINNHPHMSEDMKIALVHNGIISNYNAIAQKKNIDLKGECDSEVLIRLMEQATDATSGIHEIFKEIRYGSMACLSIDFREQNPFFYAFRNYATPIHFVDLRDEFGIYVFCSTKHIWDSAVQVSGFGRLLRDKIPIEIPAHEIWRVNSNTLQIEKIKTQESSSSDLWNNLYSSYSETHKTPQDYKKSALEKIERIQELSIRLKKFLSLDSSNAKQKIDFESIDDDLTKAEGLIQELVDIPPIIYYLTDETVDNYFNLY